MTTNGKWIASHSEEHWSDTNEFDTREEALAYAVSELAADYEVGRVYTGQIQKITDDELAGAAIDGTRIVESVDEWLYDNIGDEVDYNLPCTRTQEDDLEARLRETFKKWLADHAIAPTCYRIESVKSHDVVEERAKAALAKEPANA